MKLILGITILFLTLIQIDVFAQVPVPVITGTSTSICPGESIVLTASGCNGTVRWTIGTTGSTATVSAAGSYAARCETVSDYSSISAPYVLQSNTNFSGTINSPTGTNCANSSTLLSATGLPTGTYPQFYKNGTIMPHISSENFKTVESGNYSFRAFDKNAGTWASQTTNSSQVINDIFFLNANKGWAAGAGGYVYYTVNGGQTWTSIYVGNTELKTIWFIDENTGWAGGTNSKIYKTTNGGSSWSAATISGVNNVQQITNIRFSNANNGVATTKRGLYLKTSNGGTSWSYYASISYSGLGAVCFINENVGWLLADNYIYKTVDGANSWVPTFIPLSDSAIDVFFTDENNGWAVGNDGSVVHTTDGGTNWIAQFSNTSITLNKVRFVNASEGWIVGDEGLILHTVDGGGTWVKQVINSTASLRGLTLTDDKNIWISGDNGTIWRFTSTQKNYCLSNTVQVEASPSAPAISKTECNASNVLLSATGCNGLISWNTGATGSTLRVYSTGTYIAKCTINGCTGSDSFAETVNIGPNGSLIANNGNTCLGSDVQLTMTGLPSAYSFEWRKNGVPFDNGTNESFHPVEAGAYDVIPYLKGDRNWEMQSPAMPNVTYHGITMSSPSKGWAVGQRGTIAFTEDGGQTWRSRVIDVNMTLEDIKFVTEQLGIILVWRDNKHYVLRTTDGGKNWQLIYLNLEYGGLERIFFLNETTGWILGGQQTWLKTTDGGASWNLLDRNINMGSDSYRSLHFFDEQEGWIVGGDGVIKHTTNGGNSWTYRYNVYTHQRPLTDVYFVNRLKGFITASDNSFFVTEDGGDTWLPLQNLPDRYFTFRNKIVFTDEMTGWIISGGGILNTIDGGKTWGITNTAPTGLYGGTFIDPQHAIVAAGSNISITHDGGMTWKSSVESPKHNFKEIYYADKYKGKILGDSCIAITEDGGRTWTKHMPSISKPFADFHFINVNKGWLISSKKVYQSIDGGVNWTLKYTYNGSENFTNVHFTDDNKGWIVGSSGLVLQTSNGGTIWSTVEMPINSIYDMVNLTDVFFFQNRGWIIGFSGKIYTTDDGGTTWQKQNSETTENLNDVFFTDANTGWIATYGNMLRTTNGGLSWQKTSPYFNFSRVVFANSNKGWATTDFRGSLYVSYDGGISWISEGVSPENISCVFAISDDEVRVAGGQENIMRMGRSETAYCPTNSIVISSPTPPEISSFTNILCQNKSITLRASNCDGTVKWNTGSEGTAITVNTAGTYAATCINNSCESTTSNALVITVSGNCNTITIAPASIYSCPNKPVLLTASGCPGNNVVWSNGMTGSAIQVSLSVQTNIEAFCQNGGSQSVSVNIAVDDLNLSTNLEGGEHQIQANKNIDSSSRINSGATTAKVDYKSGKSILLKPGFEVSQQNTFKAEIKSCQN